MVDLTYLQDPLYGYPLTTEGSLAEEVKDAYLSLARGESVEAVASRASAAREQDSGFHPATLLLAQTVFLAENHEGVLALLSPVADELPDYHACNLLLGRALEQSGQVPNAYDAYGRSAFLEPARERLDALRPRAFEIVYRRFEDRFSRGHLEDAELEAGRLERWAPEDRMALDSRRRLAEATEDVEAELVALQGLLRQEPDSRLWLERVADLEIERENIEASLALYQRLVAAHPEDEGLRRKEGRAAFLWRLRRQPEQVQEVARKDELQRADLATLLYWLVPEIRFARVANPPIAMDILDHPRRDEIVRVINLGLMPVDERLHRFEPERNLSRLRTLSALIRMLSLSGQPVTCSAGAEAARQLSRTMICEASFRCGLIPELGDCLPMAPLSGLEALDLFQRALDLFGS